MGNPERPMGAEGQIPDDGLSDTKTAESTYIEDGEPGRPLTLIVTKPWLWIWVSLNTLLILSGGVFGAVLFTRELTDATADSLWASVSMAVAGAGAYYLRRIYKAAIIGRLRVISSDEAQRRLPRVLGTSMYILGRPLIAGLLALFVAMTSAAAWYGCAPSGVEPTRGLVQIATISGFLVGYFSGRSISQLESSGRIIP